MNACYKQKNQEEISNDKLIEIPKALDLNDLSENGIFTIEKQLLTPNNSGVIADIVLKLPEYQKGMYYRPFSEVKAS
ncbi:hypothetical protein [Polaribacter sp. AHE13PA]|uniref:hypothetical protein n=1 Tax=Polaribacter sp. AHE13PA TaxID=2745562 RepID=UPI001C4EDEDE|nr:hypothetical protein [Polaribacter sp. AHE13PA]QXP66387.1 hypothetical protein H0I28_14575 [Polaribacter sp. AHE13PA]